MTISLCDLTLCSCTHTAPFLQSQCLPLSQDRWQVSADWDYAGACPSPSLGVDGEFRCCHRQHQQCPEMTSLPFMSNAWQVGLKSASQSAVPQVNTKSHLSVPFHRPPSAIVAPTARRRRCDLVATVAVSANMPLTAVGAASSEHPPMSPVPCHCLRHRRHQQCPWSNIRQQPLLHLLSGPGRR